MVAPSASSAPTAPPPPKCPACRKAPVVNKQHTCPNCLQRAYCSAACLEAGRRHHRTKECPHLAFEMSMRQFQAVHHLCNQLGIMGRWEEANAACERLLRVIDMGAKHAADGETFAHFVNAVTSLCINAAEISRRLHMYDQSEARLKRWLDALERAVGRVDRILWQYCKNGVLDGLGHTYVEMGRYSDAEVYLRKAIDGFRTLLALRRVCPRDSQRTGDWEGLEVQIANATNRLVSALEEQGKITEAQQVVEAELRPFTVRRLLGPDATEAQVRAFDLEAALTVPLSHKGCVVALQSWLDFVESGDESPLPQIVACKERLVRALEELYGPYHERTVGMARLLLVLHTKELPLEEVERLYQRQRGQQRSTGDVRCGVDPGKVAGMVGSRLVNAFIEHRDVGMLRRGEAVLREAVKEAEKLAAGKPWPDLSVFLGDLGWAAVCAGDLARAAGMFEQALKEAQRVWGDELLGSGMDWQNGHWLKHYLKILEARLESAGEGADEALAARRTWLRAVYAEMRGQEHALTDQALGELRAAMRKARGVAAPERMSRRQQQRMEAQRCKAKARRLKKQRALERAQATARTEAADGEQGAAADYEAEEQEGEATAVAGGQEEEEEEEDKQECPICLEELGEAEEGREMLVSCKHVFHVACISGWRHTCRRKELTLTCPYCREEMA